MSMFKTSLWLAMPPTAFLSLASLITYLVFRLLYLATAQQAQKDQPDDRIVTNKLRSVALPWIFFGLELLILLPNALPYVLRILAIKPAVREQRRLTGDDVPNIDVLITTCNEDVQIVMDTIRAACVLDYPADSYRIFVCDDGTSAELKAAVEAHALIYSHLHYSARIKGPIKDYKAGNLNAGLVFSGALMPLTFSSPVSKETLAVEEKLCDTPKLLESEASSAGSSTLNLASGHATPVLVKLEAWGQYVAGLDADMIPEPHWLRTLVPHIDSDPNCAMVCPPQTFYDIPLNDPLTQTMSHFAGMTEVVNDALGHADCLGSGYIMRRAALEAVGGFPTESLSEDVCCSSTLLGAGWKTAFVPEAVQYGSVPESFLGHIKQRTRWWVGHIQTAMLFKLRMGSRAKHLDLRQRLTGFAFDLRQLVQVPIALSYLIIPFVLLSGSPLVFWATGQELKVLIRLVSVWSACHWLHNGVMGALASTGNEFTTYDIRMASYDSEMEQWLSPYYFIAFMRSFVLPEILGGVKTGFKASGSISSDLQERSAEHRAPLLRRLRVTLFSHLAIIHVIFIFACVAGVALNFARTFSQTDIPNLWDTAPLTSTADRLLFLVTRMGWPPLFWLQFIASAVTPITYTLWPPTQPDREELLDRDEKTGLAYPKPEARMPKTTMVNSWRYFRAAFSMAYTLVLFVANEVAGPE